MLDIQLFRTAPETVRESQRRRFSDVTLVDKVIELDNEWRKTRSANDRLNKGINLCSKQVGVKKKNKEEDGPDTPIPEAIVQKLDNLSADDVSNLNITQLKNLVVLLKKKLEDVEKTENELKEKRDQTAVLCGNIVHESVPVSDNEDNNGIERLVGECRKDHENLLGHVDLMLRLDGIDTETGSAVAGNRGYFLKNDILLLNLALINYAMQFLVARKYSPMYTPFFMNKQAMAEVAQLEQFDEELYKVSGEGEDKYLIATSEQPIAAYHRKLWMESTQLPIRYAGYSSCFRKEVGSHGRDTLGIFRVHQFEKIEQFCVTTPHDLASWKMMDEMIATSEAFYQSLGLPYRVVNIVSGKLNNAAAKKLDLEAWFPKSQTYRELVSCSNCTDYQARRLDCRFGSSKKANTDDKEFVHMLNATLCATTRTMCCIVENYQTPDGVKVPDALIPFFAGGKNFLPFLKSLPKDKKNPNAN